VIGYTGSDSFTIWRHDEGILEFENKVFLSTIIHESKSTRWLLDRIDLITFTDRPLVDWYRRMKWKQIRSILALNPPIACVQFWLLPLTWKEVVALREHENDTASYIWPNWTADAVATYLISDFVAQACLWTQWYLLLNLKNYVDVLAIIVVCGNFKRSFRSDSVWFDSSRKRKRQLASHPMTHCLPNQFSFVHIFNHR